MAWLVGVAFLVPCAQAQGRGGHLHRDMALTIRLQSCTGQDKLITVQVRVRTTTHTNHNTHQPQHTTHNTTHSNNNTQHTTTHNTQHTTTHNTQHTTTTTTTQHTTTTATTTQQQHNNKQHTTTHNKQHCGVSAVAVLRQGTLRSCCSLDFWTLLLEPLSDSPSAEVTCRSGRLLDEFHIIFYAKWTRMPLLDMVLACPSCATTELLAVLVSWTFPRAVRTWKYGTFSFTILYLAVTFSVFGCCFRYAKHWILREMT